jgi:CheY-like chemotaxis protein
VEVPQPRPRKILLADDDEVTREVLGMMLEEAGYEYEAVTRGDHAVSRALSEAFAAVVMDYEMPVQNGLEATLAIRRLERGPKLPIILLSAHTAKRAAVMGAGASAYLVKPVTLSTLVTTLDSWVKCADPAAVEPVIDDTERPADLIELFFELVPERLKRLRESARNRDLDSARSEAHRLIGSCAVLGFPRMAAVARRMVSGEIGIDQGATQLEHEFQLIAASSAPHVPCSR